MGEIAEMMLNGDLDEETGEWIGPGDGYPRSLARESRERPIRWKRRVSASPEAMAKRIRQLSKAGFDYVRFSEHHYRFEGYADFWPSTEKWRVGSSGKTGISTESLIAELRARFPNLA